MTAWCDVAWYLAVLSTGVAAGAMTGHALLLGRFFTWVFATGRTEMFGLHYPAFIAAKKPQRLFDHLFTLALLAVTAHAVLLWFADRISALSLAAAGLQWLFVAIFFGTGFAALEVELFTTGTASPERAARFLALNTRVTAVSALLLLASFACLVLVRAA